MQHLQVKAAEVQFVVELVHRCAVVPGYGRTKVAQASPCGPAVRRLGTAATPPTLGANEHLHALALSRQ